MILPARRSGELSKESLALDAASSSKLSQSLLKEAADLILASRRIIVATHKDPDGDAIGSLVGLCLFLKGMGKDVHMAWDYGKISLDRPAIEAIPNDYLFLFEGEELLRDDLKDVGPFDLFIALDCANLERLAALGELLKDTPKSINFDHHQGNPGFALLNLIDTASPATAELVYRLIKEIGGDIDARVANALYVGLLTDTGRFQYSNTNLIAFEMAGELLKLGVKPNPIYQNVYESRSVNYLKLVEKFLSRFELAGPILYSFITQDDLNATEATLEETEDLINILREVKQAKVVFVLKEEPGDLWKVSLRAKGDYDLSKLAGRFGGGGHKAAAGFVFKGAREEIVEKILAILKAEI